MEHQIVHWMAHQIRVDIDADFRRSDGASPWLVKTRGEV